MLLQVIEAIALWRIAAALERIARAAEANTADLGPFDPGAAPMRLEPILEPDDAWSLDLEPDAHFVEPTDWRLPPPRRRSWWRRVGAWLVS